MRGVTALTAVLAATTIAVTTQLAGATTGLQAKPIRVDALSSIPAEPIHLGAHASVQTKPVHRP
jgi:hypothetical protein